MLLTISDLDQGYFLVGMALGPAATDANCFSESVYVLGRLVSSRVCGITSYSFLLFDVGEFSAVTCLGIMIWFLKK
jgi:hypothetical protein